jgi:glycosyltransferase involved in cell wall biosynthesis
MTLNILISTIDQGITKVGNILRPSQPAIKYIVSQQFRDENFKVVPEQLNRPDVVVSQIPGAGLSRNRNNAIKLADGDVAIIADDDVRYLPDSFQTILEVFEDDPELDVACFKIKTLAGEPEFKDYPSEPLLFKNSFHHYISSIEIAFKTKSINENEIWFDERFGIGAKQFKAGEEEIFIHDCIKAGLKVMYFPYYIVKHPYYSSAKGIPMFQKQRNMLRGAVNARIHGWKSIPKAFYDTATNFPILIRNKRNPFCYLAERLRAIIDTFKTDREK